MNGIGLLSGSFTPHYSDSKRAEKYRENIKNKTLPDGIAVELFQYVMQQICFDDYKLVPYTSHKQALQDLQQNKKHNSCTFIIHRTNVSCLKIWDPKMLFLVAELINEMIEQYQTTGVK